MAEVSTIPAYILANEHLLFWMLRSKLTESFYSVRGKSGKNVLKTFAYVDFHRWNATRPDHVFRHRWECFERDYLKQDHKGMAGRRVNTMDDGSQYCSTVLAALKCLSDEYLSYRNNELHVKLSRFGWWQNMLSRVSALPIQAYGRWQLQREWQHVPADKRAHLTLYPFDEGVENYISRNGLNDSHVHVNLCAYAEECWLYALRNTQKEWEYQRNQFRSSAECEELYREIHIDLTPDVMLEHMQTAKRLRYLLISYANNQEVEEGELYSPLAQGKVNATSRRSIDPLTKLARLSHIPPGEWKDVHVKASEGEPCERSLTGNSPLYGVFSEMHWIQKIIEKQSTAPDSLIERVFHLYLLLMNEFMTLCVQRDNCYGFKQFQKYSDLTMSLVSSPLYYERVFERMHGGGINSQTNYAELRIGPKSTCEETEHRITCLLRGYLRYVQKHLCEAGVHYSETDKLPHVLEMLDSLLGSHAHGVRLVRPVIVLHFIKQHWKQKADPTGRRHGEQRERYSANLDDMQTLFKRYKGLQKWVRGIDAAADEMDTPPDTFAEAYRKARRVLNIPHATFHAGEDFYHLVSGIRVVCEAVDMLQLRSGDRIGHATALGVDPALWINTMPLQVTPTRGEWLLDLLFAWNLLHGVRESYDLLQKLNRDIREHGYIIFRKPNLSPYILTRLFALRTLNSRIVLKMYKKAEERLNGVTFKHPDVNKWIGETEIVNDIKAHPGTIEPYDYEKQEVYGAFCQESPEVMSLLVNWHSDADTWCESERRIEVPTDYFSQQELVLLQQLAMARLVDIGIVVETLPSSNLRIGQYKEMGQHHSLRWLGATPVPGDLPIQVVLGTDDPGVFATDIKAEFYHLFASLVKRGLTRQDALEKLIRMDESGNRYAFRSLVDNRIA